MKKSIVMMASLALALLTLLSVGCNKKPPKEDPQAESVVITRLGDKTKTKLEEIKFFLHNAEPFVICVVPKPENAKVKSMTSSNGAVATVANNTVTAVAEGEAIITVKVGRNNLETTLKVRVNEDPEAKTIAITKSDDATEQKEIELTAEGDPFVFNIVTDPTNSLIKSVTSSDTSVATVKDATVKEDPKKGIVAKDNTVLDDRVKSYKVTAVKEGETTIKVVAGRNRKSVELKVKVKPKEEGKK